jgi:cytochrome c
LALGGCGGNAAGGKTGDLASGQKLFSGELPLADASAPTCVTCHAVSPDAPESIGPNLSNIGNRAATRVPGQSAQDYLRSSIVDPDAYLANNFQEGIMYREYRRALTPQQLDDLVAYLLTLQSGQDH